MLSPVAIRFDPPSKRLALTYDDGPGPRTVEIAEFLKDQGVRATFFVVGKHVRERRDVVRRLKELGHVIGNHTYNHPGYHEIMVRPSILVQEFVEADTEIRDFLEDGALLLRTPGGTWEPPFAEILNRNERLSKYSGPFDWNVAHGDYEIGSPRGPEKKYSFEACCGNYVTDIRKQDGGIVLLHDWSADPGQRGDELRAKNRTLELTQWLVPQLDGFNFVTLDNINHN